MRPDRGVPRRARRGGRRQRRRVVHLVVDAAQAAAHEVADRAGDRLGDDVGHHANSTVAGHRRQLAHRTHRQAHELLGALEVLDDRAFEELGVARHGFGLPRHRLGVRSALRVEVEQRRQHQRSGRTVDRGVVHLGERGRDAALVDAVDDVQLPQRPGPVERAAVDATDDLAELLRRARRRHGVVSHVEVEVEVGVLDPIRQVEAERHFDEPTPERRQQPEAIGDELLASR